MFGFSTGVANFLNSRVSHSRETKDTSSTPACELPPIVWRCATAGGDKSASINNEGRTLFALVRKTVRKIHSHNDNYNEADNREEGGKTVRAAGG